LFWLAAACYGAGGGFIVSAVAFCADIFAWQDECHRRRRKRITPSSRLAEFVSPKADTIVLFTRIGAGGIAGYVFHGEVVGGIAAIAVGAAAPALLAGFGKRAFPDMISEPGEEIKTESKDSISEDIPRQRMSSAERLPLPEESQ
jgi:hypothetical protein